MALGGGVFTTQNKVLPGSYINFVSVKKASANLSDRGYCTMPLELDWGVDGEIFEVTNEDFQKNSLAIFGYSYTDEKLKGLRDLFLNAKVLFGYRLNSGVKASCEFATAKYSGVRGNDLTIVIQTNVDDDTLFDVSTLVDTKVVDKQTVSDVTELVSNNFVDWKDEALTLTAGTALVGGTNGTVTASNHQEYLDKIEAYSFNTLGVVCEDDVLKQLYTNFTKRMRDEVGAKFQTVLHNCNADYEGVINVKNETINSESKANIVYWLTGLQGACAVNKSCLNKKYDGEFTVYTSFTQTELSNAIKNGEFVLHKSNGEVRTLSDVNSLVTETEEKGVVFKDNQSIRVMDQIGNDIAVLFNTKYVGVVPNDNAGRVSLWSDIVKHHEELQKLRAIENFKDSDITVEQGETKNSVLVQDRIEVVNAMGKLYMTVRIA